MDGDKVFAYTLTGILALVALTIMLLSVVYCRHVEKMAELGYEEAGLPGRADLIWRKAPLREAKE